jgi:hypothetical protein
MKFRQNFGKALVIGLRRARGQNAKKHEQQASSSSLPNLCQSFAQELRRFGQIRQWKTLAEVFVSKEQDEHAGRPQTPLRP